MIGFAVSINYNGDVIIGFAVSINYNGDAIIGFAVSIKYNGDVYFGFGDFKVDCKVGIRDSDGRKRSGMRLFSL